MPTYTICKTFIKSSKWVWNHLRDARTLDMQLKEESITDFFIMNLKRWKPAGLEIKTFTRHEESTTGSDWAWWFTGPSGKWLGMLIQAKVITLQTSCYDQLHYIQKNGTHQRQRLEEDARKKKMIPAYCLYTNWPAQDHKTLKKQSKRAEFRRTEYGAALLSVDDATTMQASKHKSLEQSMPYLKPLHELFCPDASKTEDLPNFVYHNLLKTDTRQSIRELTAQQERLHRNAIFDGRENIYTGWSRFGDDGNIFLQREAAPYVYQLIRTNANSTQLPDLDNNNNDIGRVTLFRQLR